MLKHLFIVFDRFVFSRQYISFFINVANNFVLSYPGDRFIDAMFIASCVSTVTENLHYAWFSFVITWIVINLFAFKALSSPIHCFFYPTSLQLTACWWSLSIKWESSQLHGKIELSLTSRLQINYKIQIFRPY